MALKGTADANEKRVEARDKVTERREEREESPREKGRTKSLSDLYQFGNVKDVFNEQIELVKFKKDDVTVTEGEDFVTLAINTKSVKLVKNQLLDVNAKEAIVKEPLRHTVLKSRTKSSAEEYLDYVLTLNLDLLKFVLVQLQAALVTLDNDDSEVGDKFRRILPDIGGTETFVGILSAINKVGQISKEMKYMIDPEVSARIAGLADFAYISDLALGLGGREDDNVVTENVKSVVYDTLDSPERREDLAILPKSTVGEKRPERRRTRIR